MRMAGFVRDGDDTSEVLRRAHLQDLMVAIRPFLPVYPQSFYDSDLRHWRSQSLISKLDYHWLSWLQRALLNPVFDSPFGDAASM